MEILRRILMFTEMQIAECLSAIIYLDSLTLGPLSEVIERMKNTEIEWPCRMNRQEWMAVLDRASKDEVVNNMQVVEIEYHENGHKAALFSLQNKAYVIFRGTGSDFEWEDNAIGMTASDTAQQKIAAGFVARLSNQYAKTTVAGHSKGGNKAQYAAITLPKHLVNQAFSFDGQGFSLAFLSKYADALEERKNVITLISERRGFVHALGIPLAETKYFAGRRGDAREGRPHGDTLAYFHCPDALWDASGSFGHISEHNPIPKIMNSIMSHFLKTKHHSKYVESTAKGLVRLMCHSKKLEESAAAIAQLMLVFMELLATDKSFRKQVVSMIHTESDVLLASLDNAYGKSGKLSALGRKTALKLGMKLAKDRAARLHFVEFGRFVGKLKSHKIHDHLVEGFGIARRKMIEEGGVQKM